MDPALAQKEDALRGELAEVTRQREEQQDREKEDKEGELKEQQQPSSRGMLGSMQDLITGEVAYDATSRTVTIAGSTSSFDASSLGYAKVFYGLNRKNGSLNATFFKAGRCKLATGLDVLASQQAIGKLMFPEKNPSRQQALVSDLVCGKGTAPSIIAFLALLFGCFILEQATPSVDKTELLRSNGNDATTFRSGNQTALPTGPRSKSAVYCHELRAAIDAGFTTKFDKGCGNARRIKMAEAAWSTIEIQQPLDMEPETRVAFAFGKAKFIELATAKKKVIHKARKNRVHVNNKKCKAEANSTSGSEVTEAVDLG